MIPLFLFLVCIYTVDNLFYTCPCTLCCMNLYLYYKSHDYSTIRPATAESLRSTTPTTHISTWTGAYGWKLLVPSGTVWPVILYYTETVP